MLEVIDRILLAVSRQSWDRLTMALAAASVLYILGLVGYLARQLDQRSPGPEDCGA